MSFDNKYQHTLIGGPSHGRTVWASFYDLKYFDEFSGELYYRIDGELKFYYNGIKEYDHEGRPRE